MDAPSTNYEKFQTANPVVRRLIERFYAGVEAELAPLGAESLLDAGCGEGETLLRLHHLMPADLCAVDSSETAVELTRRRVPGADVAVESVYSLPFGEGRFDVVLCLEVLEHLDDPGAGLAELRRVSRGDVILSVPSEPWFRLGSAARGKYLATWGNHPEHVNHWNPRTFRALCAKRFSSVEVRRSTPWLIAHCRH